jgi:hypothetical protein
MDSRGPGKAIEATMAVILIVLVAAGPSNAAPGRATGQASEMEAAPSASSPAGVVPLAQLPTWMSAETDLFGTGLAVGDIDGDGLLDLAVSNGNDMAAAPNLVYLNASAGMPVEAAWVSDDQRFSGHCELADLDGDGHPELMVANYIGPDWSPGRVQVYRNVGGVLETTPSWQTPATIFSFRASFGDPDGDGDLDLAVATGEAYHAETQANLIYFNEDGWLADAPGWTSDHLDTSYDVTFVDHDGDGDQDLAFLGGGWQGRAVIHENVGGAIATSPTWTTAATDNGNTFDFDDLDGDGRLDLAVGFNTQLGGSGRFAVYLTDGGALPTSPSWTSAFSGYGSAIVCADVDGNGHADLVAGGWWEPVRIYLNDGLGGFASEPDWQSDPAWASVIENFVLADLDEGRTRSLEESFPAGSRLLDLPHRHLQGIDRVTIGGETLARDRWCGSTHDGWVSLEAPATSPVTVVYRVSDAPDLALSNWDDATFVYGNTRPVGVPEAAPAALIGALASWPNPFNPRTTIAFRLAADVPGARLAVFDLRGRHVATLVDGALSAGEHRIDWQPRGLSSGVYLYRLEAGGETAAGKMVLVR